MAPARVVPRFHTRVDETRGETKRVLTAGIKQTVHVESEPFLEGKSFRLMQLNLTPAR